MFKLWINDLFYTSGIVNARGMIFHKRTEDTYQLFLIFAGYNKLISCRVLSHYKKKGEKSMLLTSEVFHNISFAEIAVRMLNFTAWQQLEELERREENWKRLLKEKEFPENLESFKEMSKFDFT
jgi:hypothetical protein